MNYLDLLKKYWKPLALVVWTAAALIVGYYLAPKPSVQIQEHIVTQEKKVIDEQMVQAEVNKRVEAITKDLDKHTTTIVVTKKDGSKVEKTTTDTHVKSTKNTVTDQTKTQVVTKVEYVDRVVTKDVEVKVETAKPQWIVGLAAGPEIEGLKTPNIMVGAEVDRRIIGPFFVGLSGGVSLSPINGSPKNGFVLLNLKGEF